jgi:vitamin B12 transporter
MPVNPALAQDAGLPEQRLVDDVTPAEKRPLETTVRGTLSMARQLRQSAEAVTVVEFRTEQKQSADLAEVLSRSPGIVVRRAGGLGSAASLSLSGMSDEQLRFFVDGVPLEVAGYGPQWSDIPVSLVERVELYRGVVPIRLGADALGGTVNIVTGSERRTGVSVTQQVGSFGTQRLSITGQYHNPQNGIGLNALAFRDTATNDYLMRVDVADESGRLTTTPVRRFHDAYRAAGAAVEVGWHDRPWAKQLSLRLFASRIDKELQHNLVASVPYGEVTTATTTYGLTARYLYAPSSTLQLGASANAARRLIDFRDAAQWVYAWSGERLRQRAVSGEIEGKPTDQTTWQDSLWARVSVNFTPHSRHVLRAVFTQDYAARSGDERMQLDAAARDPLNARRRRASLVSGLEYELRIAGNHGQPMPNHRPGKVDALLHNALFVKHYAYHVESEETLPGDIYRPLTQQAQRLGLGDSLRLQLRAGLALKASYEYATRLPSPDEVFGNGVLVLPNLRLQPETSHNTNLTVSAESRSETVGNLTLELNGFLRVSDQLIVLLGNDRFFSHQNIANTRAWGAESAFAWSAPGKWLTLDASATVQDIRNQSKAGPTAAFRGDRVPNRPWLFGSISGRLRWNDVLLAGDAIEPFFYSRYVHPFFRGWESLGVEQYKQVVPGSLSHTVGVSWSSVIFNAPTTVTAEIQNLANAPLFDAFGVQRPGRAFFLKLSVALER